MRYTVTFVDSGEVYPITLEEIDQISQCDNEYLALQVGQLNAGESQRFGGGAEPLYDITAVAA